MDLPVVAEELSLSAALKL